VKLYDSNIPPKLADAVYWSSTGGPPEFGTPGAAGPAGFVDISFRGGSPLGPDGSIGRSPEPAAAWTGTCADFATEGGPAAAGPTPGRDNRILHFTPQELADRALDEVQLYILRYAMGAAPGWIEIRAARAHVVASTAGKSGMQTLSRFELEVHDAASGVLQLSGEFLVSAETSSRRGMSKYIQTIRGALSSAGPYGIRFEQSAATTGFGWLTQWTTVSTALMIEMGSERMQWDSTSTSSRERTGPSQWRIATRTETHMGAGTPAAHSTGTANITELEDGRLDVIALVERDVPQGPGQLAAPTRTTESFAAHTLDRSRGDGGGFASDILEFYYKQDGRLAATLAAGATGVLASGRLATTRPEFENPADGSFFISLQLPLRNADDSQSLQISTDADWVCHAPADGRYGTNRYETRGIVTSHGGLAPVASYYFCAAHPTHPTFYNGGFGDLRVPCVDAFALLSVPAMTPAGDTMPGAARELASVAALQWIERLGAQPILVGSQDVNVDVTIGAR
jgi:hypothetical protein